MSASPASQVLTVAGYEVRKYLRGRRLLGMLIILAVIVALLLALPAILGTPYATDANRFVSTFASFTGILVVLSGVLFAADALVSEYEKRTGYFLFPQPVRREVLVAGKLVASVLTAGLVISLYYAAAAIASLAVTGHITWEAGLSYLYALAYMAAVVGIAYLISSSLKTTVAATVLTFFLFTLIFSIVGGVLNVAKVSPWFIPSSAAVIITDVLASPTSFGGPGGGFLTPFVPDVATSLAVFAACFLAGALLAVYLFRRRELSS